MTEQVNNTGNKSKKSMVYLALAIIFFLGIIGVFMYFMPKIKEYKQMVSEKEIQKQEIQHSLDQMIAKRDSIKTLYGELSDSLLVRDSIIEQKAKEIKKLLNYKWEYHKVNKKLALLRKITQKYVFKMDSLYSANETLHKENTKIKKQYSEEVKKNEVLTKTKEQLEEKVENAAVLKATGIEVATVRFSASGKAKPTNKAKKIKRIKVCFTVNSNPLVDKSFKSLYMRIAKPNQEIMIKDASDKYTFTYQGSTMQFTAKKDFQYTGVDQDVCINYSIPTKNLPLVPGKYVATLYLDDNVVGEKIFALR